MTCLKFELFMAFKRKTLVLSCRLSGFHVNVETTIFCITEGVFWIISKHFFVSVGNPLIFVKTLSRFSVLLKWRLKSNFGSWFSQNLDFAKFEKLTSIKMAYLECLPESDFFENVGLMFVLFVFFSFIPIFLILNFYIQLVDLYLS